MIAVKLNCSKIEKARLFKGEKGLYLDLVLVENKDGVDQYGNAGFVSHSVSKEEREKGVKGTIIGNFKYIGQKPAAKKPTAPKPDPADGDGDEEKDDVPF